MVALDAASLHGMVATGTAALTRDYYVVEDAAGHRFWLYRDGLYGRETARRTGSCMGCLRGVVRAQFMRVRSP